MDISLLILIYFPSFLACFNSILYCFVFLVLSPLAAACHHSLVHFLPHWALILVFSFRASHRLFWSWGCNGVAECSFLIVLSPWFLWFHVCHPAAWLAFPCMRFHLRRRRAAGPARLLSIVWQREWESRKRRDKSTERDECCAVSIGDLWQHSSCSWLVSIKSFLSQPLGGGGKSSNWQLGAWEEHWMVGEDLGPNPGSTMWWDPEQVTSWYEPSVSSGIDQMSFEAPYVLEVSEPLLLWVSTPDSFILHWSLLCRTVNALV